MFLSSGRRLSQAKCIFQLLVLCPRRRASSAAVQPVLHLREHVIRGRPRRELGAVGREHVEVVGDDQLHGGGQGRVLAKVAVVVHARQAGAVAPPPWHGGGVPP